jgi:hypothetical protein
VEEKLRVIEGLVKTFVFGMEGASGIRNLRRIETAIFCGSGRDAGKLRFR